MRRIIFLNCYAHSVVSGGIKTMYEHAFLLRKAGFDAHVMQGGGVPRWLDQKFAHLVRDDVTDLARDDIVVFPETLENWFAEMIEAPLKGHKVIFCQNSNYFFTCRPTREKLESWGVRRVLSPGRRAGLLVRNVLGLDEVPVTSPVIDGSIFRPLPKRLQIAVSSNKWPTQPPYPQYAGLLRDMLVLKYPEFADVPWISLQGKSEAEMAKLLGESVVCVSLARLEALGMLSLEAMAAGCVVVGFHGGGGLDYATPQNGFWHNPEELEQMTDSLAIALAGAVGNNPVIRKMIEQGQRSVQAYSPAAVSVQLQRVYAQLQQDLL